MSEQEVFYKLPEQTLPAISFEDHASDLRAFTAFVEGLGINTHNTRIARYVQYFDGLVGGEKIDEKKIFKNVNDVRFQSSLDWQLYLLREAHELMWILRGLKKHVPSGIESKIEKIVSGSDFAALDTNTESRDTQFELRIASYFCQSGCEVDLSTNTDIIAQANKHVFFVECKRIAGIRNLKDNLVKAKNQLLLRMPAQYGGKPARGIIAADVTKLGFTHNGLTIGLTSDHSRDIIQSKLKMIGQKVSMLPIFTGRPDIIECFLQIHIPSIVSHPPATTTRFSSYPLHSQKLDRKSRAAINEFFAISQAGRIIDDREIPSAKLKLREFIDVPAGSQFSLEQGLITKVLSVVGDEGCEPESIVATLRINDVVHEFTVLDLRMFVRKFTLDQLHVFSTTETTDRFELVLKMFGQRYPYEGTP